MNKFNAIDHISELNTFKNSLSTFDKDTLSECFRICGIPSNPMFIQEMINSQIVVRISVGIYQFKSDKPIHYSTLQTIYNKYADRVRRYNKTDTKIQNCINYLKENGYTVIKGRTICQNN